MKLAHTMIRVRDLERTLEFYRDLIGLREVGRKEIGDEATLVFLTDEDEKYFVELTYNHDNPDYTLGDQYGHLAFGADDLDEVEVDVRRRGWQYWPSRPELKSRYLFVCDPDGYDVEIIERK